MAQNSWVHISTFLSAEGAAPENYIPICGLPVNDADVPAGFPALGKSYGSVQAMLDDDWLAVDQAVLAAGQVFGQTTFTPITPTRVVIIRRAVPVAQVTEFTVLNADDGDWKLFISLIDGTAVEAATYAASSVTVTVIKDALISAFNIGPFTATQTAADVDVDSGDVTADVPGAPFILTATGPNGAADVQIDVGTPSSGLYEDLDATFKILPFWKAIPNPAEAEGTQLEAGRWAEASKAEGSPRRNVAGLTSDDGDILTATLPNFADVNIGLGRTRTFIMYHPNLTDQVHAARFGRYGALFPGSRVWHLAEQGGSALTTTINYDNADTTILKAARVSWLERFGPVSTAPLRAVWGQGSGGFFITSKQAEDSWWFDVGVAIMRELGSQKGSQLSSSGLAKLVTAVNEVNIKYGTNDPPVLDLARTTITPVPLEDVPAADLQIGKYTSPTGGINVSTVLVPGAREIGVSATFLLS